MFPREPIKESASPAKGTSVVNRKLVGVIAAVIGGLMFACSEGNPYLVPTPPLFGTGTAKPHLMTSTPAGLYPATQTAQPFPTLTIWEQLALVDESLKQSLSASIAFNTPNEMIVDESATITLLLNPSIPPEELAGELATQITEPENVVVSSVEITPRMKAVLISQDKNAFDIQDVHDDPEQFISSTKTTEWSWIVTARKDGPQKLTLIIYRLIKVESLEEWYLVETFYRDIDVNVTWTQRLKQFDWYWLIGPIIVLILIPAMWRYIDHRTAARRTVARQNREKNREEGKMKKNVTSILFLAADPTDASRLRLGEEFREIQEQLKLAQLRDRFNLELPQLSVRPPDISQALLDTKPQIVHFSGHGASSGALCFENQIGQAQLVQPDALAALFEQFSSQVNCVLLNACYSEPQANAISEHIKYVIGMNKAISDKAAVAFAIGFYQALGAGKSIEDSYEFGCVQIRLQGIPEHLTPVLIKKA